jgi:hypothetical protein
MREANPGIPRREVYTKVFVRSVAALAYHRHFGLPHHPGSPCYCARGRRKWCPCPSSSGKRVSVRDPGIHPVLFRHPRGGAGRQILATQDQGAVQPLEPGDLTNTLVSNHLIIRVRSGCRTRIKACPLQDGVRGRRRLRLVRERK